jgi:hypothetical protein
MSQQAKKPIKKLEKNRTLFNPQQWLFLEHFLAVGKRTFGNYMQSALAAGYTLATAKNFSVRERQWLEKALAEIGGKPTDPKSMVNKARSVLDKSLSSPDEKLAQDTGKFVAKNYDPEAKERTDLTTGDGKIEQIRVTFGRKAKK